MRACECCLSLFFRMLRRYERLDGMLKHFDDQTLGETLGCFLEVEDHSVTLSYPHQAGGVWFHPFHYQFHGSPRMERPRADICFSKTDRRSRGASYGLYRCGDLFTMDIKTPVTVLVAL